MHVIDLIFEAGNRSQVSLPLKLQESDGALLEKETIAFALARKQRSDTEKNDHDEPLKRTGWILFWICAGSAR